MEKTKKQRPEQTWRTKARAQSKQKLERTEKKNREQEVSDESIEEEDTPNSKRPEHNKNRKQGITEIPKRK